MLLFLLSCKTNVSLTSSDNRVQIKRLSFLDEYTYPANQIILNSKIGGLSGIDYKNGNYYLIVDDAKSPRVLKAKIDIKEDKIQNINFTDVITLSGDDFYSNNVLDLESVFLDQHSGLLYISSEGSARFKKEPKVFSVDTDGKFIKEFILPKRVTANVNGEFNTRHNGSFEGMSESFDKKGFWIASELPLKLDGEEPFYNSKENHPIRFTYYDKESGKAKREFAYQLSPILRPKKGKLNINGITAILEYKKDHFYVVERTYQEGYAKSNLVKVFDVSLDKNVSNTVSMESLRDVKVQFANKKLLLDFESFRNELTDQIIDNIEGITFGPQLSDGNPSLLLVSDDNFQSFGKQLNQFILLKIEK